MSTDNPSPFAAPAPTPAPSGRNTTMMILLIVMGSMLVVLLLCGGVMAALLIPAVSAARQAARQAMSQNNLKQIGLALHNYHAVHNTLPPAYATDSRGNPTVSWRVLILPYLEDQMLYNQFDLSQPWDSPANASLADRMPSVYLSPVHENVPANHTTYVAVRSPQSLFPGDQGVTFPDVTDGLASTLFALDLPNFSVPWSAPDDSSPADVFQALSTSPMPVPVAFGDGAVRRLEPNTSQSDLDAMITRDGNDSVVMP